mgnify:CR=1 FL=1
MLYAAVIAVAIVALAATTAIAVLVDTAATVAASIDARREFELLAPTTTVMVVFRWVGDGTLTDAELDRANTDVQRRLFDEGRAVIGRTTIGGRVALKFTVVNPDLTVDDLVALLDAIADEVVREG